MSFLAVLLRLVVVAAVVLLLWWGFRPAPDFTIVVSKDAVRIRGRFPKALKRRVTQFLQQEVVLQGTVRISGSRRPDGSLALKFRGPLSQAERQRIRNLLVNVF